MTIKEPDQEPTTKNNLGVDCISREFQEIVVTYSSEDLFDYPEYKGKPYFSIKYIENGKHFIGYGTYNPKVFSRYLRDYFMPSVTPQEPFINKPCVSEKVCEHDKQMVLDKIRAEIMDTGAYEQEVNGKTEFLKGINYCLSVIDKYKAEIEPQNSKEKNK